MKGGHLLFYNQPGCTKRHCRNLVQLRGGTSRVCVPTARLRRTGRVLA